MKVLEYVVVDTEAGGASETKMVCVSDDCPVCGEAICALDWAAREDSVAACAMRIKSGEVEIRVRPFV